MSESRKSVHVRLSTEAHRVLSALGEIEEKDNAELARLIIEEVLFGRVHVLKVKAERYQSPGLRGILRDLEGSSGKTGK